MLGNVWKWLVLSFFQVWLLVGVYGGCGLLAILIMVLALENVTKQESFYKAQKWQVKECPKHHIYTLNIYTYVCIDTFPM